MKLLFDLLPLLLFFVAYRRFDIYVATGVAIAASVGQILWLLLRRRRIEPAVWVSLVIIALFGGATIALHDESFIKWKPTVLYWVGAVVLAGGELIGRSALRGLLGTQLVLPDSIWRRLTWAWVGFLGAIGTANLAVAFTCSTETWVSFKVFGLFGVMLAFVVVQSLFLGKYIEPPADAKPRDGA
ncbi:MAG: septation protein A [Polyangiaceae bacterium]|nr:septation protein A [Polyangiaceae bacterium]